MEHEKRRHSRFNPKGLVANITIIPPPPLEEMLIAGTIVDMSYTGIKIKLENPVEKNISGSEIKIIFTMPDSGIPVAIHGMIRHLNNDFELGLQYSKDHPEHKIDGLMFECIKSSAQHVQGKGVVIPFPVRNKS